MTHFATIKKERGQRVEPPTSFMLPPPAKHVLREQHSQSDKNLLIYLAKESNRHSHSVILQRPSMLEHRGVIALSAICAHASHNALRSAQSQLPTGNRITGSILSRRSQ
jgi:hypothetical protein